MDTKIDNTQDADEHTETRYIKVGNTTVEVVSHFSGTKTLDEVIKDALRREVETGYFRQNS